MTAFLAEKCPKCVAGCHWCNYTETIVTDTPAVSLHDLKKAVNEVYEECPHEDNGDAAIYNPGMLQLQAWHESLDRLCEKLGVQV